MKALIAAVITTIAVGAAPAHAGYPDSWGTVEDAEKCASSFDSNSPHFINGNYVKGDNGKSVRSTNAAPECQAELDKRAALCLKDPGMVQNLEYYRTNRDAAANWRAKLLKADPDQGPTTICLGEAFDRLYAQRKRAAEQKAELEKWMAEAAKVELPKADKKDAALEKQIAAAYKAAYPANTVLMVLLQQKSWSTERSDYGVITNRNYQAIVVNKHPDGTCQLHNELWMQEYIGGRFKGPLMQRGAGSQELKPILCEKVPGANKPAKGTK